MSENDLDKIKQFIRVSQDIESILRVNDLQKKILLQLIALSSKHSHPINIGTLSNSITGFSSRSVLRHIHPLKDAGWINITHDHFDHRIKHVTPTSRLIKVLSQKLSLF